jgi:DNA segregation ATPase FtsK/SpoIIIE, S-DNA-T family
MAEEAVKEKVKRVKKPLPEETIDEGTPAPLIDEDSLKTGFGLFFLFASILLFISFCSYLFTWQEDQDKVLNFSWRIIFSKAALVENKMGRIGAFLSHVFFYDFFGIASFLVPYILFTIGINLTFKERIFSLPYSGLFLFPPYPLLFFRIMPSLLAAASAKTTSNGFQH